MWITVLVLLVPLHHNVRNEICHTSASSHFSVLNECALKSLKRLCAERDKEGELCVSGHTD